MSTDVVTAGSPVGADYKSPNAFAGRIDLRSISAQSTRTRGEIEKLERKVRFRKAMSD